MDGLSLDVFDFILDYLERLTGRGSMASYACVARSWQVAIEARTMKHISLDHQDKLETFKEVFSGKTSHRRSGLRYLYLCTRLPTMSATPEEHEKSNTCFESVMIKFFKVLDTLAREANGSGRFGPISVALHWISGGPMAEQPNGMDWPPEDSFLTLPEGSLAGVESTNIVSELKTMASPGITPHPAALCQIASKMTSLQSLTLQLFEPTLGESAMRIEHHQALAAGILDFRNSLPDLQILTLRHQNQQSFRNHSFECPDMTDDHGVDQLSRALRKLAENGKLVKLELKGLCLSSDLFSNRASPPDEAKGPSASSEWSSLRILDITIGLVAANGQWFCTGDRDVVPHSPSSSSEYSEDSQQSPLYDRRARSPWAEHAIKNNWRRTLDTTTFDPFVEDLMCAVTQRMPSIERFGLGISWDPIVDGAVSILGEKAHNVKRFQSQICTDWVLPETIIAMAKEWVGPSGVVKWRTFSYRDRWDGDWNYLTANQDA